MAPSDWLDFSGWKQRQKLGKLCYYSSPGHLGLIVIGVIIWLSELFARNSGLISCKSDLYSVLVSWLVTVDYGLVFWAGCCRL